MSVLEWPSLYAAYTMILNSAMSFVLMSSEWLNLLVLGAGGSGVILIALIILR